MHCTVLMPAYNTSAFIGDAIKSVLSQTYDDWDLLIVDDGSRDDTVMVASSYMKNHPVSIVRLVKNKGVAAATKLGIDYAIGPVITVVDSDDKITANSLAVAMPHFIADKHLGFLWTSFICSTGRQGWSGPLPKNTTLWDAMTKRRWWRCSHQRFFHKKYYAKSPGFDERIAASSDFQLALLMGSTGCRTKFIRKVTYWYRMNRRGNLSTDGRFQRKCAHKALEWAKKGFPRKGG